MDKRLIIKIFKIRKKTLNNVSRVIVVGYNTSKVNGGYIERIGSFGSLRSLGRHANYLINTDMVISINLRRLGFWLNKGAIIKNSRITWALGLLSNVEREK